MASDGATYTFDGSIGLAPKWGDRRLTGAERGWISACMLARVNIFGVSLLISMRGPSPALSVSAEEAAAYTIEEGAFYGNIFADGGQSQVFIACGGLAQASGVQGEELSQRACARESEVGDGLTECGMQYAQHCTSFTNGDAMACEERHGVNEANGFYERCHDVATTDPKSGWAGSARYDQVVTVYLRP